MNKTIRFIAGILAITAISCENTQPGEMKQDAETVIIANTADTDINSRTAIDPTDYFGGHIGILWTPDDAIGVFGGTVRNARFACSATAPTGRAAFTGNCATPQYAYYPYSAANDGADPTSLTGTLQANQSFDSASQRIDGDYKFGYPRPNTENEFDFTHIFALLRFNIEATGTPLAGEYLKSISLALPEGRQLAGDFTFDATDGSYAFAGNTSSTVTLEWADIPALTAGKSYTAYMSVAPDLHADDQVVITILTDRHKATFTKAIAYDFMPNTVYTFNLQLRDFAADMNVEELPVEPEEETANCYMITSAGQHDFKATVIGNGQKGIIPGAGFHTENANIAPRSAALLWEDVQGFISDVELRDGRVYYTTSGNVGNAVIAVYSGTDRQGDILWSWHIWGVGDSMPQDYAITTKEGSTFDIMDRNLGAFPSTDAQRLETTRTAENEAYVLNCMLYQWGRKDPFPNADTYYTGGAAQNIASSFPVWQPATSAEATIGASVLRPGYIINRAADSNGSHWLGTDCRLLWGDDAMASGSDGGWSDVKTIYDPSPVGYRVANGNTFTAFIPVNKTSITMKGVIDFHTGDNGEKIPKLTENINCVVETEYDGTTPRWLPRGIHRTRIGFAYGSSSNSDKIFGYGIYMKRSDDDSEGNYYAMGGVRFPNPNGARDHFAKSGYWWTSSAATADTRRSQMALQHFFWLTGSGNYAEPDKGLASGRSSGVNGNVVAKDSSNPWQAQAVRCVREK